MNSRKENFQSVKKDKNNKIKQSFFIFDVIQKINGKGQNITRNRMQKTTMLSFPTDMRTYFKTSMEKL